MGEMAASQTLLPTCCYVVGAVCEEANPAPHSTGRYRASQKPETRRNHLYEYLYNILRSDAHETEKFPALRRIKAKIVRLHASRKAKILVDTNLDKMDCEEPSLYHVLKMRRRHNVREIGHVKDSHGNTPHPTKLPTLL